LSEEVKPRRTPSTASLVAGSVEVCQTPTDDGRDAGPSDAWQVLLRAISEAPDVDPGPFFKLPPGNHVLLGRHLGHFRILDRIGEGGMGIVYKAEDENLRRAVALKVLRPRFLEDEAQHQRLIREAQSAAAFNHPNIAAIYEIGQADGLTFIAMEYVDGKPLRSVLQGQLPHPSAVHRYAIEIARGLARAHGAGIVHRDLKPENLLLDSDSHIKVLDFGLAKPAQETAEETPSRSAGCEANSGFATQDGQIVGTPVYMSPEQAEGGRVDTRSDIYSFGVVLHELLTGKIPNRGETSAPAPGKDSLFDDALPPSVARADLLCIAERCLRPNKEERFADGTALLAALEAVGSPAAGSHQKQLRSRPRPWQLASIGVAASACIALLWMIGNTLPRASAALKAHLSSSAPVSRRLATNPSANIISDAEISPDGQKLAYTDQTGLYLRGINSADAQRVDLPTTLRPLGLSWFPDSESLFIAALEQGRVSYTIWKLDRDGGLQKLSDAQFGLVPKLSPDGKAYAWVESREGIYWETLGGHRPQLLVPLAEGDFFLNPVWSPDSRRIAYVRLREAKKGPQPFIETVDLTGSPPRILVQRQDLIQDHGEVALGWMPDGRMIYGVAEVPPKEPGTTLWTLAVDLVTGEPLRDPVALSTWTGPIEGTLSASKKGSVVFQRNTGQMDIYVADLWDDGKQLGAKRRLTSTPRDERPTDWSPDGQSIAFMSDESGVQQVFLLNTNTSETRLITSGPAWHTWPRFTPDGLLLFWQLPPAPNEEPSQMELMRLGNDEEPPIRVFAAGLPVRFKRNGRPPPRNVQFRCPRAGSCVYSELVWNQLRFAEFDARTGPGRELIRIDAERTPTFIDWDISHDGSKIAIPLWGTEGMLQILNLATNEVTNKHLWAGCNLQFASWRSDGQAVFVTAMCTGENQYKLFLSELEGATHVLFESPNEWIGNPVASADGRRLAFATKPQTIDVWLLEGF
jgi:serine/threonine protein kinase